MVCAYEAPRFVSLPTASRDVDNEWAIAAFVAALLGIAIAIVLAVCAFCGTLGSWWSCYWTMVSWIQGYWC
jgi:hypothetical protein